MKTQELGAIVDELLARSFPREEEHDGDRSSGPSYHVQVLCASQDFWEDRSEEIVEAAEAEIEAARQGLTEVLTARWGNPEPFDLWPLEEDPAPEPIDQLSMLSTRMHLWRHATPDRWVALLVGQQDAEFPIELLAAVSDAPIRAPKSPRP
ncbi:hypothetical protein [Actinomadura meyerae]|uniref:hypothetical protein n=1 Tax=Actinomadura meyerae TaxID=240840 RepID=UPI000B773CD2|nr:hypothetical protein [Actinomadura meyerae]